MAKYCCCEHFYNLDEFIEGARVVFRELPIRMVRELRLLSDDEFTIKRMLIKCNGLGDLMVVAELDQLPGVYFSPNVLTIKKLNANPVEKIRDNTMAQLIKDINDLNMENTALRHHLARNIKNNFEVE